MSKRNHGNIIDAVVAKTSFEPVRYSQSIVLTQSGRSYFPYTEWYKGQYMSDIPIIAEREAGFRPRLEREKVVTPATGHAYPQHCFRPGITTKYPCYPECTEAYKRYDPTLQRETKLYMYR
jgi:hypothetical protein